MVGTKLKEITYFYLKKEKGGLCVIERTVIALYFKVVVS